MENGTWDRYVRIPTSSLDSIELRHLESAKDMTIASEDGALDETTITGLTEWTGAWHGEPISIGWDWAVVGGVVIVLNPNEIRTNIRLVTNSGSDEPSALNKIRLLHWIESIPWREIAIKNLLDEDED
jgi:hypothetical protein